MPKGSAYMLCKYLLRITAGDNYLNGSVSQWLNKDVVQVNHFTFRQLRNPLEHEALTCFCIQFHMCVEITFGEGKPVLVREDSQKCNLHKCWIKESWRCHNHVGSDNKYQY